MDVMQLIARISLDTSEYDRGLSKASSEADGIAGKIGGAMSKVGSAIGGAVKLAAAGITAATGAVAAFAGSAVKAGMSFDAAMAQVAATSGKTVDEIQDLRAFAQQMGATTAFSATQAAEALNYMALAGYDADQSMEMLPNVLNLAAAGGMELATASDMVTDAQTALGLSAERTSQMVDEMAKVSSTTNTSVSQLGEAMLTVGGTAKTLSGGFYTLADGTQVAYDGTAELSQALGLLADNGIKGSEGGTKLRNMILSLSAPTDKAADAIQSLGVDIFDAEGNMRSLKDVFGDMSAAMDDMSSEERVNMINTIFNKTDLKAVNALLDTNAERWDEVAEAINGAEGAAADMANTQLDNLAGDVTIFKSALEGVQIAISDRVAPVLRQFVQMATNGLSNITSAIQAGDWSSAFTIVGDVIGQGITKLADMLPQMISFGGKLLGALADGIVNNIGQLAKAADTIMLNLFSGMLEASRRETGVPEIVKQIVEGFISRLEMFLKVGSEILINIINGLSDSLPDLIDTAAKILETLVQAIIDKAPNLIEAAANLILNLATGLAKNLPTLIPKAVDMVLTIVQGLLDNVDQLIEAAVQLVVGFVTGIINALPLLVEKAPEIIKSLIIGIVNALPLLLEAGATMLKTLAEGIMETLPILAESALEIIGAIAGGLIGGFYTIVDTGKQLVEKLKESIFSFDFAEWGRDMLQSLADGIRSGIGMLGDAASAAAGRIASFLHFSVPDEGPLSDFDTYGPDMMELLAAGVENSVGSMAERIRIALETVRLVFVTFMEGIVTLFNGDEGLLSNINRALEEWSYTLTEGTLPNLFTSILDLIILYLSGDSEIMASIRGFFEQIGMEIQAFLGEESGIVSQLLSMFTAIDEMLVTNLGTITTRVTTFTQQLTTKINSFISTTKTNVSTFLKFVADTTNTYLNTTIKGHTDTFFTYLLKKTHDDLLGDGDESAIGMIKKFFQELEDKVREYIDSADASAIIIDVMTQFSEWLSDTLTTMFSEEEEGGILYMVTEMFVRLLEIMEESLLGEESAKSIVEELCAFITSAITEIVDAAFGWGAELGQNFADGIWSMVAEVEAAAAALAGAAAGAIHFSTPDYGPLKNEDEWGGELVQNFIDSMLDKRNDLRLATEDLFDIKDAMLPSYDTLSGMMTTTNPALSTNQTGIMGGYTQIINNYSPDPLDASEIARQTQNATQSMVLALRSA